MGNDTDFHCLVTADVATHLSAIQTSPSSPITPEELHQAIHSSSPWKAPGHDDLPCACFRECETVLTPFLLHLFSASLRLGAILDSWKIANVVAIPKPGKDPLSPSGYRPISLLPTLSKLLERIITDRLTYYLETQQLLDPFQFGFR